MHHKTQHATDRRSMHAVVIRRRIGEMLRIGEIAFMVAAGIALAPFAIALAAVFVPLGCIIWLCGKVKHFGRDCYREAMTARQAKADNGGA